MNILFLFIGVLAQILHANNSIYLVDTILDYTIEVPNEFVDNTWPPSIGSTGKKVDHMTKNLYDFTDPRSVTIEVYNTPTHPCTATIIGVSQPTVHTATTIWGEVDFSFSPHDSIPELNGEEPFCKPPRVAKPDVKENRFFGTAAYALCSEYNGKSIKICLSQQTDNPAQAKEIFESFRWLEPTDIFHDIPVTHPLAKSLEYLKEKAIITGYPDNTFQPQSSINRVEFLKILTIAANLEPKTCTSPTFTDTDATAWYMPSLERAYCHDLVQGYGDGTFKPEQTINAAEMYKIVTKAFNLPIPHGTSDNWYSSYERALQSINAIPESIKSPSQLLTRGEMAEVVYRVMQYKK